MDEPSVLDYVKALLTPWRGSPPAIPRAEDLEFEDKQEKAMPIALAEEPLSSDTAADKFALPAAALKKSGASLAASLPWLSIAGFGLALIAQSTLEPHPGRTWTTALTLYLAAGALLVWAAGRGEFQLPQAPPDLDKPDAQQVRLPALLLTALLGAGAFFTLGGNRFTGPNILLWTLTILAAFQTFWLKDSKPVHPARILAALLRRDTWTIAVSRWTILLILVAGLAVFFRMHRLDLVPPEMTSDHAEKLLDVEDVLRGETRIFFPRNTGREAIQFYLTAAVSVIFGTGISFTSLKIGTLLAGLLTLPFIYLIGKEIGNRQAGFWAVVFAAIAYWPNTITRVALRFSLYPLFVAPTLYFLLRGLKRSNRNDFILSGFFLGLGLHGYTPFRIVPLLILAGVLIYLLHKKGPSSRSRAIFHLAVLAFIALILFLPLLRYAQEHPQEFAFRAFTRLGDWERPLPGPAWQIFLKNMWNAMIMFAWDNGVVWTISIPNRPALDMISAALFYIGLLLVSYRYARQRNWQDLFLVISVPILMLPSVLSLAFPDENPVLNRTAGAIVPVFVIIGLTLESFLNSIRLRWNSQAGGRLAWGIGILLLAWSASLNYELVFNKYQQSYRDSSWNSSEMDRVIKDFITLTGEPNNAWIFSYPHWVDTRLVGLNIGLPMKDYAITVEQLPSTRQQPGPKLFLVNPQHEAALTALQALYPLGWSQVYASAYKNKDFIIFFAPPQE